MPLIRRIKPERLQKDDLFISVEVDLVEIEGEVYPYADLLLVQYKGIVDPRLNRIWGGVTEDMTLFRVVELASYCYTHRDTSFAMYQGGYFEPLPLDYYVGVVSGKLNVKDHGELKDYMRRVFRYCWPYISDLMRDAQLDFIDDWIL